MTKNISHVVMVDKDYTKKQTNDTIRLSEDLEDIMRKIGWTRKSHKISPEEAYYVVVYAMENNPNSVKTSELGSTAKPLLAQTS